MGASTKARARDSRQGFESRAACIEDAAEHGYIAEEREEPNCPITYEAKRAGKNQVHLVRSPMAQVLATAE